MFPFGYGLSYTQFDWQREVIYNADSSHVEVELVNTGDRAGKETVQLYALTRHSKQLNPVIQLVDFRKVRMEPGERKRVDFDLLKVRNKMNIKEGDEVIWAFGNSSRNLPIKLAVH
jgi:beta-glucosidase